MLRFRVEVLSCEWADSVVEDRCIEMRFRKRGARCRVENIPTEMVVRSSPETEHLFVVALQGEEAIGCSDAIEIGGVARCVGARTVEVKSVGAKAATVCFVRFMWSSEREDWTVFFREVEDYESTAPPLLKGEKETVLDETVPCSEQKSASPRENGASWCVGTPQYAPSGFLNYFATSTQSLEGPGVWHNLYTCPSPLLVASREQLSKEGCKGGASVVAKPRKRFNVRVFGCGSAIEDICLNPTKLLDMTVDYTQRLHYQSKVNPQWRTCTSTEKPNVISFLPERGTKEN